MVARSARRGTGTARSSARRAADSPAMVWLARAGLVARGVMYVLIGWIALQIAFGNSSQQADRTGALRLIGKSGPGSIVLWLLVIGFTGLALWRLSQAIWGAPGADGRKATKRLGALARTVLYGFLAFGVLKYALGLGAPQSSNSQSQDLTATAMKYPGGQVIVALAGLALIAAGAAQAYSYWRKKFLRDLRMGSASATTRRTVTRLGQVGGVARGVVFITAGIFLVVAAVDAQPSQAKGIDSSLRTLASTPAGPWLLGLVAAGLIVFGVFSCCQARWAAV